MKRRLPVAGICLCLLVGNPASANAGGRSDAAFDVTVLTYATAMSKAEFCDLEERYDLKADILAIVQQIPGVDRIAVEDKLDTAYKLERDRLPHECKPDDVRLYLKILSGSLDDLQQAIADEF